MLFEKYEGFSNSEHDNFMHEAVDETRLFSVNQLTLTRVVSKFCMSRVWNKMY